MSNQLKTGKFQAILAIVFSITIAFTSGDLLGQSGTRQGSGTTQNPFSPNPTGAQDKFQLPSQVPGLPAQTTPNLNQPQFQEVAVNEKYAGWMQAGDGSMGRLGDILRAQWVMASQTGSVNGIVYGIEDADVGNLKITLLYNGREVTSVRPKDDGSFAFANVRQGTYALVGWGDNAFFAFGLNVLRHNDERNENVPSELKITATQNKTTINTDWIQFFATGVEFPVYGRYEQGEGEDDPAELYGLNGLQLYMPPSRPATSISSHQVIPAADGRLFGRVHQLTSRNGRPVDLRNTRIMLLKNDDVYAAVTTDSYGVFEFPEIPAGEYACVAVGRDGLGCIGIYVGEPAIDDDEFAPISFAMTPSETTGWIHSVARETAYQRVVSRPRYNYEEQEYYGDFGNQGCHGPRALRPGGYRPPPRSAIPKDERFFRKANRFVDGIFFQDARNGGNGYNYGGGYGTGGNGYPGGYGNGYNTGGNYYGNGFGANAPISGPVTQGSTSRNQIPTEIERK